MMQKRVLPRFGKKKRQALELGAFC